MILLRDILVSISIAKCWLPCILRPPIRPGSAANKTRPSSGQLRPLLSAQGSSILTNSSGVSLASKPPSSTCRGCHKPMRTASRRPRVLSTESDDDDDDSASTTDWKRCYMTIHHHDWEILFSSQTGAEIV